MLQQRHTRGILPRFDLLAVLAILVRLALLGCLAILVGGPGASSPVIIPSPVGDNWCEIISERSRFAKVYEGPDDTRMMRISPDPVHYRDEHQSWQEINTRIVASANADALEMTRNDYRVYFQSESTAPYLVRFETRDGEVEFGLDEQQSWGRLEEVRAESSGNSVSYRNLFPGIDLSYTLSASQMTEELVVRDRAFVGGLSRVQKRFTARGVSGSVEPDGSVGFYNASGERTWTIPRPVLYELDSRQTDNHGIHFEMVARDGYFELVKVIDPAGIAWLNDPQRRFPVVVDDTVTLNDGYLAGGTGYVQCGLSRCSRRTDHANVAVGRIPALGLTYRSFLEWDTSVIPRDAVIQSVGVYFHVSFPYGLLDTVAIKQLPSPVSSYANDSAHNQELFDDLGAAADYIPRLYLWGRPDDLILSLGTDISQPNLALADLSSRIASGAPFGVGLVGSNETDAFAMLVASANTDSPGDHPALIVTFKSVKGSVAPMIRPLRNTFFDGQYYWMFFRVADNAQYGQYYYYSADGRHWTEAGRLSSSGNQHHGEWYSPPNTVFAAFANEVIGPASDLYFAKGTLSYHPSPDILWGTPAALFKATRNPTTDSYDFPSVSQDSTGKCWVLTRHMTTNTAGLEIVHSTDSSCSAWASPTTLLEPTDNGGDSGVGAYVVPLDNGRVYVVYKNLRSLEGKLYDGTSWASAAEVIESNAAFGVYSQGMSIVSGGSSVQLAYIAGDGSLTFRSWNGAWGDALTLDEEGTFWSPSLSLDLSDNSLFVVYRKGSDKNRGNGTVYSRRGAPPYGAGDWSAPVVVRAGSYSPQPVFGAGSPGSTSPWSVSTNYSGNGRNFAMFVDGVYGLEFSSLHLSQTYLPLISR